MIEFIRRRRGRQHDLPAAVPDLREQFSGSGKRLHLLQIPRLEDPAMLLAQLFLLGFVGIRKQGRHQHVSAFSDLVVDRLIIECRADLAEYCLPCRNVMVVAVHEGAVDVEKNRFDRHGVAAPELAPQRMAHGDRHQEGPHRAPRPAMPDPDDEASRTAPA
ncbi:hypothetical protein SPHINGO8AM_70128 [Sphingomonas sp. 8AM]|nr:hypothetical protein SPHINGO8AM_70128 [Sphingomonas sp. 8AM]